MHSIQDFTNYTHFSPQESAYQFTSVIEASEVGKGGAYVRVPVNIKEYFGKGRLKVRVYFEMVYYEGSIVNMGVKKSGWQCLLYSRCPQRYSSRTTKKHWRYIDCFLPTYTLEFINTKNPG